MANDPESKLPELVSKTFAEATIPVPLFALVHVKNLQADLASLQADYERAKNEVIISGNRQVETEKQLLDLRIRLREKALALDDMSRQVEVFRLIAQKNCAEASSMRSSLERSQGELSITQHRLADARLEIEMLRRILAATQYAGTGGDVSPTSFDSC